MRQADMAVGVAVIGAPHRAVACQTGHRSPSDNGVVQDYTVHGSVHQATPAQYRQTASFLIKPRSRYVLVGQD